MDLFEWLSTSLNRYRKPQPGFQYEALDSGLWRCLNCHPARIVWRDQLTFHAQSKHGFKAEDVRIEPSRNA